MMVGKLYEELKPKVGHGEFEDAFNEALENMRQVYQIKTEVSSLIRGRKAGQQMLQCPALAFVSMRHLVANTNQVDR